MILLSIRLSTIYQLYTMRLVLFRLKNQLCTVQMLKSSTCRLLIKLFLGLFTLRINVISVSTSESLGELISAKAVTTLCAT